MFDNDWGDFDSDEPFERHLAHQAAKGRVERPVPVEEILSQPCARCGYDLVDGGCPNCGASIDLRRVQVGCPACGGMDVTEPCPATDDGNHLLDPVSA